MTWGVGFALARREMWTGEPERGPDVPVFSTWGPVLGTQEWIDVLMSPVGSALSRGPGGPGDRYELPARIIEHLNHVPGAEKNALRAALWAGPFSWPTVGNAPTDTLNAVQPPGTHA